MRVREVTDYRGRRQPLVTDYDTAKKMVKSCGWYVSDIDPRIFTQELADLAIINNREPSVGELFEYIPEKFRTLKLCDIAIQQDGWSYKHVPDNIKKARGITYGYIMALENYTLLGFFDRKERKVIYSKIEREKPDYWAEIRPRVQWLEENFWPN